MTAQVLDVKLKVNDLFALMRFEKFDGSLDIIDPFEGESVDAHRHQRSFRVNLTAASKKCHANTRLIR